MTGSKPKRIRADGRQNVPLVSDDAVNVDRKDVLVVVTPCHQLGQRLLAGLDGHIDAYKMSTKPRILDKLT